MPDQSQRLQDALSARYRIERTLGRSVRATVFLADDLQHRPQALVRFLTELAACQDT